jgi:hypothetical protein
MDVASKIPDFQTKDQLYTMVYGRNCPKVIVDELDITLPSMPKDKTTIRNYGLPKKDQKWKREVVPTDLRFWDSRSERKYIDAMWHKRLNGEWWYIKGKPYYLTGYNWFFLNFWRMESGQLPDFRMESVKFFWVWHYVENNPDCYGFVDIKPRRIGDTEKTLCIGYDYVTRYRNMWFGMQNLTGMDAKDNYTRVVDAHNRVPYFFKPKNRGSSHPTDQLIFKYPVDYITKKSLKGKTDIDKAVEAFTEYSKNELGSKIDYETTKFKRYDGKRLGFYHLDEPGKMDEMNPVKQWEVIKRCLSLYNGRVIVGKAIMTTTVEDVKNGETVMNMRKLWKESDPKNVIDGRTVNGLVRVFRSARENFRTDEWGFHLQSEMEDYNKEVKRYEDEKLYDDLTEFKRKHPMTVDEALTIPADDCVLHPALLDEQIKNLKKGTDPDGGEIEPTERGNLEWEGGVWGSKVMFIPEPINGRWVFSQHPSKLQQNNHTVRRGMKHPENKTIFSIGIDPVDHYINTKSSQHSEAAIAVFKKPNPDVDGKSNELLEINDGKILNPWNMYTDQFICTYSYRHNDPNDFYEDALKTCLYFGTPAFTEKNKPGVNNYFRLRGFLGYLQSRPKETQTGRRFQIEKGISASTNIIDHYIGLLKSHIARRWSTYKHLGQLEDMRQFNAQNRGDRDITVASGFALMAAEDKKLLPSTEKQEDNWTKITYKKHLSHV